MANYYRKGKVVHLKQILFLDSLYILKGKHHISKCALALLFQALALSSMQKIDLYIIETMVPDLVLALQFSYLTSLVILWKTSLQLSNYLLITIRALHIRTLINTYL